MKIETYALCIHDGCNEPLYWSRGLRGWFSKDVNRILCNHAPTPESGHAIAQIEGKPANLMPIDLHPFDLRDKVVLVDEAEFEIVFANSGQEDGTVHYEPGEQPMPAEVTGIGWDGKHLTMTVQWDSVFELHTYDIGSFIPAGDDAPDIWCDKHLKWVLVTEGHLAPGFAGSIYWMDLECGCQRSDHSGDGLEAAR